MTLATDGVLAKGKVLRGKLAKNRAKKSVSLRGYLRLARRAGATRVGKRALVDGDLVCRTFLGNVLRVALEHVMHGHRNTVTHRDVVEGLRGQGVVFYGCQ